MLALIIGGSRAATIGTNTNDRRIGSHTRDELVPGLASEHEDGVGRDKNAGCRWLAIARHPVRFDASAVAVRRIIIVRVAVENFAPSTNTGPRQLVICKSIVVQTGYDHHIPPFSWKPALEGEDTVIIMHMQHAERLASQCGLRTTQPNQLFHKPVKAPHICIFPEVKSVPPKQQVRMTPSVIRPLFVLEE